MYSKSEHLPAQDFLCVCVCFCKCLSENSVFMSPCVFAGTWSALWFCDCLPIHVFVWPFLFVCLLSMCAWIHCNVFVSVFVCVCVCTFDPSTSWTPECPQWHRGMAGCLNQQPTANRGHFQFRWLSVLSLWLKHTHTNIRKTNIHAWKHQEFIICISIWLVNPQLVGNHA